MPEPLRPFDVTVQVKLKLSIKNEVSCRLANTQEPCCAQAQTDQYTVNYDLSLVCEVTYVADSSSTPSGHPNLSNCKQLCGAFRVSNAVLVMRFLERSKSNQLFT